MGQQYLSVTTLTKYLKRKFEADPYLERVYLTGEISNFRLRPNAHQYFSLKDEAAKISAIMFRPAFQNLKFQPKEGMKVLVIGRISLYEASGNYQIYVEHMEPDGVGALYQALEEMKSKLNKEGLFTAPKKELVHFPRRVAILTSPSGAVIRDIITTVRRRYPIAQLVLFPTLVQGNQAADDIVKHIHQVEEDGHFDTMIIARGGGSIEDLWPFNEEKVARAIFQAKTPIISSVGHETDTTIADLVADVRAATPTAAAELAVPVLSEELIKIKEKENRIIQNFSFLLHKNQQRYLHVKESYIFTQSDRLYEGLSLKLDLLNQRLNQSMLNILQINKADFLQTNSQFLQIPLDSRVKESYQRTIFLQQQLMDRMKQLMLGKETEFNRAVQALDLLSPLKIMRRGYSYTTKENQVISSVDKLHVGDALEVYFTDGKAKVAVQEVLTDKSIEGGKEK